MCILTKLYCPPPPHTHTRLSHVISTSSQNNHIRLTHCTMIESSSMSHLAVKTKVILPTRLSFIRSKFMFFTDPVVVPRTGHSPKVEVTKLVMFTSL